MAPANVWRGYDQAGLDHQYNSRGTVPDASVYLREYAARTRDAKAKLACSENLRYGGGADEVLDIYPAARSGAAVLVFLHGGDWRTLSKEDGGFAAPAFVGAGAMFVAINFSLVPATTLPAMGVQVRRALLWLWKNVTAHGGDPERMHIAGHSSGANLVGQLLMTDWLSDFSAPANLIKSAVFISGLGDLLPVRLSFRNQNLKLSASVVAQASLLRRKPGTQCPMLVAVGENETDDYRRQSREVADYWRTQGNAVDLFELKGRNHFDAVLEWADSSSDVFRANQALLQL